MNNSRVAVDASFLLKIFLPEDKSDEAEGRWKDWIKDSIEVVAPTLIVFEVSSVLRNKVYRGILKKGDAAKIINEIRHLDLVLVYTDELLDTAWEIGAILKAPTLYDCFYIALSRILEIPLWTSDKKLYNSAKRNFSFLNLL